MQTQDVANTFVNFLIGEVDTYRYPNVYELDLRVQKTFQIGPVTVIPTVELFNATNGNTVINSYPVVGNYDTGVPQLRPKSGPFDQDPHFNQILEVQSPRIVRLGLQVNF